MEQLQNASKEAIIDLLEARIQVAEATLANMIAAGIYADGTGYAGKEIDGLRQQVIATPTNTVGGIDRNASIGAFWKNQVFDISDSGSGALSSSNILTYMNTLWAK